MRRRLLGLFLWMRRRGLRGVRRRGLNGLPREPLAGVMGAMSLARVSGIMTAGFPLWLLLACAWAWWQPEAWVGFRPWISIALGVVMLGMGLTLRFSDFAAVLKDPKRIALGVFAQFAIMPLVGWALAKAFQLETGLALGLILVGCCPGGTVSNVICHLARANVPLSVLLTMTSTMVAVVATPWLTRWLAGAWMPVDAWALFQSMLVVVLLPLILGIAVNTLLEKMRDPRKARAWIDALWWWWPSSAASSPGKGTRSPPPPGRFSCPCSCSTSSVSCSATCSRSSPVAGKACAARSPSRSACRTAASVRRWPPNISLSSPWLPSPPRSPPFSIA
jgi:hypothetical protein